MIYSKNDDKKVLVNIRNRLETDVIALTNLITEEYVSGRANNIFCKGHVPHWGLLRMTMPIAESIGALLYDNAGPSKNLIDTFSNEFSRLDINYDKFKNILVMLYRHPLVHTDELRSININGYHIGFSLDITNLAKHLKILKVKDKVQTYLIHFNHRQFADDIKSVLNGLIKRSDQNEWEGQLADRYFKWTKLDLDDPEQRKRLKINKTAYDSIKNTEVPLLENASADKSYPE